MIKLKFEFLNGVFRLSSMIPLILLLVSCWFSSAMFLLFCISGANLLKSIHSCRKLQFWQEITMTLFMRKYTVGHWGQSVTLIFCGLCLLNFIVYRHPMIIMSLSEISPKCPKKTKSHFHLEGMQVTFFEPILPPICNQLKLRTAGHHNLMPPFLCLTSYRKARSRGLDVYSKLKNLRITG